MYSQSVSQTRPSHNGWKPEVISLTWFKDRLFISGLDDVRVLQYFFKIFRTKPPEEVAEEGPSQSSGEA